jgi:tRNA pseudouridine38-40 synthase
MYLCAGSKIRDSLRYFIEIAYNGKNYHGWQIQPNAISVQEVLEKALSTLTNQEIKLMGAGRTDTGVHAKQLFAHFDMENMDQSIDLVYRLNSFLPKDISVKNIFKVNKEAHARFDATRRFYEYIISLRKDPFSENFSYFILQKPDIDKMNLAAEMLLNHDNFKCFSRSNTDVKTYHCDITKAVWISDNDRLVFRIEADRFLRNMVRAIVGTLLDVGFGKISLKEFHEILKSDDRTKAGASVPAHGLFLVEITYPDSVYL